MKVKELIEKLKRVNCDAEIAIAYDDISIFGTYQRTASSDIELYQEEGVDDLVMLSHLNLTDVKSISKV